MSEETLLTWAREMVDIILEDIYDPYLSTHGDWAAKLLADKIKEDLPTLVEEGFCADCQYKRRCET